MITLQKVLEKRDELIGNGLPSAEAFRFFLAWLGENEKALDPDALAYFDEVLENAYRLAKEQTEKLPDSPDTRKTKRAVARYKGTHVSVRGMLQVFEKKHPYHSKIVDDWSELLNETHQAIADFLFDLTSDKSGFKCSVVVVTLLYGCIDELVSSHFLGRHFYFIQANAHLRTVLETLDRVELFLSKPEWIGVWANGDWRTIQEELGPSAVRKKLGRDRFDPLYGYLSNNGTHASFDTFRTRAYQEVDSSNQARVFVGGTPFEHLQIFHFHFSIVVSSLLLSRVTGLFTNVLNSEEAEQTLRALTVKFKEFHERHFKPWAVENNMDVAEFDAMFESLLK